MSALDLLNSSSFPSSYGHGVQFAMKQLSGLHNNEGVYVSSLDWEGCTINETTLRNCTAACQDPTLVFASTSTLQNCMVLSKLDSSKLDSTNNLTPHALNLLDRYSINVTKTEFQEFNKTIQNCFTMYCNANHNCGIPDFDDYKTMFFFGTHL